MFYNLAPGPNVIKLFTDAIYKFSYLARVFVRLSGKGCQGQTHESLFCKFVNYKQKSFISLAPVPNVIKLFTDTIFECL
jgi:hypothetical protein